MDVDRKTQRQVAPVIEATPRAHATETVQRRSAGAGAVMRAMHAGGNQQLIQAKRNSALIQARTVVGSSRDPLEHEADVAASRVLAGQPAGSLSPVGSVTQGKDATGGGTPDLDRALGAGGGATLPAPVQTKLESGFGRDLSAVRVHTGATSNAAAQSIGAQAFTSGNDIHFAQGKFAPGTSAGQELIAHEVAHTVQQSGGGGVQRKAVQRAEDQGLWLQQLTLAKDSFFDLVMANQIGVDSFESTAEVKDPPPMWQQILGAVAQVALAAALGGIGGVIVGKLVTKGMQVVTEFAIRAAVKAGEEGIKKGVSAAISGSAGSGDKAPLKSFVETQKMGLVEAAKKAREEFVVRAGTFTDQKMTIAEMAGCKKGNDEAFSAASTLMMQKMIIGWMNMMAGANAVGKDGTDLESLSNKGVLGLKIEGRDGKVTRIKAAKAKGLNNGLCAQLTGQKVGTFTNHAGAAGKSGLDVTAVTEDYSFTLDAATWGKLEAAGKAPSSMFMAGAGKYVNFAIGRNRNGGSAFYDTDWQWIVSDWGSGAESGRWFLANVKTPQAILAELDNFTLPSVSN